MKKPLAHVRTLITDSVHDAVGEGDRISQINKQKLSAGKGFAVKDSGTLTSGSVKVTDTVTEPVALVEDAAKVEPTPEPVAPAAPVVDAAAIQDLISTFKDQIASERAERDRLAAERDEQLKALKAEIDAAKAESDAAKASKDSLVKAFALDRTVGNPEPVKDATTAGVPMVNRMTTLNSDSPQGAAKDALDLFQKAPKVVKTNSSGGQFVSSDNRELNRFIKDNRKQVVRDLESWAKSNGLLRGRNTVVATDAATTIGNIPGGFLETLSAIMRTNNRPGFVFHQFPVTRVDFSKGMGDTIKIPRAAYLPVASDPDDRLLSGGGTFVRTDSSNQNLSTGVVSAVLNEWGLGKNSQFPPVGIPAFVEAYSMIDLMMILDRNLMYDYYYWEDLRIRRLWSQTSRVLYNDNGQVTTTAGDVGAGDDGSLTEEFLNNVYGYLRGLQVPTYMDGCYGIVANSKSLTAFKNSLGDKFHPATEIQLQELLNIMNPALEENLDRATGYVGKFCNMHLFDSNAFGCGAVATEGVQTTAFGAGNTTTRSSYAFGADTIGRGVGTEVEIRRDNNDDFQRLNRFIWRSEEGFVAMDVDPTGYSDSSAVPQQLRVVELRTSDVSV